MSDHSNTHHQMPTPTAGTDTAMDAPKVTNPNQQPGGAEHPETVSASPRTTRLLPPMGWLGLVLFVVGIIVIGIAVATTQNSTPDETPVSEGSLGPVSALPLDDSVGPNAIIGEVTVPATVAVFATTQSTSIARVDPGTYGLLDSEPGWAHIVLAGPNSNGLYATGWVQIRDGLTLTTG